MKFGLPLITLLVLSCSSSTVQLNVVDEDQVSYSYLALGDSYTIGTAVESQYAYPYQLRDSIFKAKGKKLDVRIIAKNGWRTDDLKMGIANSRIDTVYDIVSLLIGVNNQYQGKTYEFYRSEFSDLLDTADKYSKSADRIFVLSIPDYGYTPFGSANKDKIGAELNVYNQIADSICKQRGIDFYNITDISRLADKNKNLIAEDDLHPSAYQYAQWVSRILENVSAKLP